MVGSDGREVRPSQTAAERAQVSRSVGSPESGRAAWAADERVGQSHGRPPRLAAERAWRAGPSANFTQLHEKESDFI